MRTAQPADSPVVGAEEAGPRRHEAPTLPDEKQAGHHKGRASRQPSAEPVPGYRAPATDKNRPQGKRDQEQPRPVIHRNPRNAEEHERKEQSPQHQLFVPRESQPRPAGKQPQSAKGLQAEWNGREKQDRTIVPGMAAIRVARAEVPEVERRPVGGPA